MSDALVLRAKELDTPAVAVIATDPGGSVVYWSAGAVRVYGWSEEEALGRNILDLTPTETSREAAAEIMQRLSRGQSWDGEFVVRDRAGRSFVCHVTDVPVRRDDGELLGIIGLSRPVPTIERPQPSSLCSSRSSSDSSLSRTDPVILP